MEGASGLPADKNFLVAVRVRPENDIELASNHKQVVKVLDTKVLCYDPDIPEPVGVSPRRKRGTKPVMQRRAKNLSYAFDYVFDEHSTQTEVFEHTTKLLIDGVLGGMNSTAFAYGATGAGKTHTMLGTEAEPGVMVLTIQELFARMEANKHDKIYDVEVSYLEVYNETIRDLLEPSADLPLREDAEKGMVVVGLSVHKPKSAEELFSMLAYGNEHRTQHPTDANACSSRSHAVFTVYVLQRDRTASINTEIRRGKLLLIDLAGSERATATSNRGARMREGANINKSLLALGNCINALVTNSNSGSAKCHVPYRDSKLTRLLKDSLGGNSRTVMIANVSPSAMWYEDTHNTLKYANRAKSIKVKAVANVLAVRHHVGQYAELVTSLRQEVKELKERLAKYERNGKPIAHQQQQPAQQHQPQRPQRQTTPQDVLRAIEADIKGALAEKREGLLELCQVEKMERHIVRHQAMLKALQLRIPALHATQEEQQLLATRLSRELSGQTIKLQQVSQMKESKWAHIQGLDRKLQQLGRRVLAEVYPEDTQWALLSEIQAHGRDMDMEYRGTQAHEVMGEQADSVVWAEPLLVQLASLAQTFWSSLPAQDAVPAEVASQYTQCMRALEQIPTLARQKAPSPPNFKAPQPLRSWAAAKENTSPQFGPPSILPTAPVSAADMGLQPVKLRSIIKSSPSRRRSPLGNSSAANAREAEGGKRKRVTFGANITHRSPVHKAKRQALMSGVTSRSPRRQVGTPSKLPLPSYLAGTAAFRARQEANVKRIQEIRVDHSNEPAGSKSMGTLKRKLAWN
eukprot:comp22034_c0_seq1/m.31986 comp22034_c0_seq1/g.31986  ORF comp22034_c0_seq1/g.31986 comp22034_c0_seq1/m.31986 type:complete len:803 (-) comp22034_c0_seq1:619-3027(-)